MNVTRTLIDKMNTNDTIDNNSYEDRRLRTELVEVDELGNELFLGSNKFVVEGQLFTLSKIFNVDTPVSIQYLNNDLNVNVQTNGYSEAGYRREKAICLFGVGTDGAEFAQNGVKEVDEKKKGIPVDSMIPFRYVDTANDLSVELQAKYFMRKVDGSIAKYYLKKFETTPVIKSRFEDGTVIDANVHLSSKTENIETFIEVPIKITKEDVREYFIAEEGGIEYSYINTFAFYAGVYDDDIDDYVWVNGISKVNVSNIALDNPDKDVNLVYRIFIG